MGSHPVPAAGMVTVEVAGGLLLGLGCWHWAAVSSVAGEEEAPVVAAETMSSAGVWSVGAQQPLLREGGVGDA